jgi:multidrug transporter EmrE-like cation transporter
MAEMWSIIVVLLISIVAALGALFFKRGSAKFSLSVSGLFKNKNLLIGAVLYAIAVIMFVFSLKGGELSILYPFVSTGFIWTAIFSVKFLREGMNRYKWLGIALIIIGVSVIGFA